MFFGKLFVIPIAEQEEANAFVCVVVFEYERHSHVSIYRSKR